MKNRKMLTRGTILQTLLEALKPLSWVYAFYEGGAAAFNRIDEWSDIDAYLVVDDDKISETFDVVEKALRALSPIKLKLDVPQLPWPGVSQAFYRLENASEYLVLDLAVLKLGSQEKFLDRKIHGDVVFYFNKGNRVKPVPFDKDAFVKKLRARLERLRARFDMFNNFVQKELNRGNSLEAIDLYYGLILAMLVEALRIKHKPWHYDFRMRYVHYELPSETVEKLEHLYFVRDEKDLQEKHIQAAKWFNDVMLEIHKKDLERLIGTA